MAGKREKKKLGSVLLEEGRITPDQLSSGITEQKETGERLGSTLVRLGFVTEEEIASAVSTQLGIPLLDLETAVVEPQAVELIPERLAEKYTAMPVCMERGELVVAMADPLNLDAIQDLEFASDRNIVPTVATATGIGKAIRTHYHISEPMDEIVGKMSAGLVEVVPERIDVTEDIAAAAKKGASPPIIRMVNNIIHDAVKAGASDIHLEPTDREVAVRQRVDGIMRTVFNLPKWVQGAVTSRVKIIGKLDIAEKRVPQDGRVRIRVGDREVDLRISVLPVQYGESIVMRLLDTGGKVPGLGGLGASETDHRRMADLVERPRGLVLVTGPTGSGKTCTLYSMIDHVRDDSVNVVSIEDPVEHEFRGVKQVAVNTKTGLTFARGLKSILRQDPDVIMVGEMRDPETSSIAMQASLTGHLVLSTLHTNTAAGAVTRLRNMGLPPYLLASSITGVIAQRLVRRLCAHCRTLHIPSEEDLRGLAMTGARGTAFYTGSGCERCGGTGYRGRTAVFEIFAVDSRAKELITEGAPEEVLVKAAREGGMRSLLEDGIDKAARGVTSLEELNRVLRADVEPEGRLCRRCGGGLKGGFRCCPWCGAAAENRCSCCGGTREEGWKFCPWCEPAREAPRVVDLPAND